MCRCQTVSCSIFKILKILQLRLQTFAKINTKFENQNDLQSFFAIVFLEFIIFIKKKSICERKKSFLLSSMLRGSSIHKNRFLNRLHGGSMSYYTTSWVRLQDGSRKLAPKNNKGFDEVRKVWLFSKSRRF